MTVPITTQQVRQFTAAWYAALDVHAPLDECLGMLTNNGLSMRFPGDDINEFLSFQRWYERVVSLFFDEKHTVRSVEVLSATDDQAEVSVVVRWQASWWAPPAAESQRIELESAQKWTVRRCSPTKNAFGLEIVTYLLIDKFKYAPGSAELPESAPVDTGALVALNYRFAEMEQQGGPEAVEFFGVHLSRDLVFRRASGKVVGKFGTEGFLEGLSENPFESRTVGDLSLNVEGDRTLVTLIITGTRNDDKSIHRYLNIRSFSRRGEHWVLDFWYNYEIPGVYREPAHARWGERR